MSNIMLRYADTHNLTVGLPLDGKWELGGYPAYGILKKMENSKVLIEFY